MRKTIFVMLLAISSMGTLILVSNSYHGNAIVRGRVLFDEAHSEWISIEGNYKEFADSLRAMGYIVERTTLSPLTYEIIEEYDVYVVGTAWEVFTQAEIDNIVQFAVNGGGIFLTGLGWSWVNPSENRTLDNYPMNLIARNFGIEFLDDSICDPTDNYGANPMTPVFHIAHSIAGNDIQIGGPISPAPLRALTTEPQAAVFGDADAYSNGDNYPVGSYPPVVMATTHGQGKVVCIGHEAYLTDDDYDSSGVPHIYGYDNLQLGLNIINWLAESYDPEKHWYKYQGNPLNLALDRVFDPWVTYDSKDGFKMWHTGIGTDGKQRIYYATSSNGINWKPYGMVLDFGAIGSWEELSVSKPVVLYDGINYRMWYVGYTSMRTRIGLATSEDGISWTKHVGTPVLSPGGNGGWDDADLGVFTVIKDGTSYKMWYNGKGYDGIQRIGLATSSDGISWTKHPNNPVLEPGSNGWDSYHIYTGPVVTNGSHYSMYYTGQDYSKNRVGLATSPDGLEWSKYEDNPVLDTGLPGSWGSAYIFAASIVRRDDSLLMWYWGSEGTTEQIGLATSGVYFYDCTWGLGSPYYVTVFLDRRHQVTSFVFNKDEKQLGFTIVADDSGSCNITIPRPRLDSPFNVTINEAPTIFSMEQNENDTTVSFTYSLGAQYVNITGMERGYIVGDLNHDGIVNIIDITQVAMNFGHTEKDYDP